MPRKPWMPATLNGWAALVGKTVTLLVLFFSGMFYIVSGVSGLQNLPADVDGLRAEMSEFGTKLDGLIARDSVEWAENRLFRVQTNCILGKVVREEPIGRFDCVPESGESEQ